MEQALLESSAGRILDLPLYYKSVAAGRRYWNLLTVYSLYMILKGCTVQVPSLDIYAANVQFRLYAVYNQKRCEESVMYLSSTA